MSYCRFSSDNWKSDVYAYESDNGYVTHVAAIRYVGVPEVPPLGSVSSEEWLEAHNTQMAWLESAEGVPINGPYDGRTFVDTTPGGLLSRLLALREAGYHVPGDALERAKEEADA